MAAVRDLVRPEPGVPVVGGTFFVLLPSLAAGAPVAFPRRLGRQLRALAPQATYLTPPQLRAALAAGVRSPGGSTADRRRSARRCWRPCGGPARARPGASTR